MKSQLFRWPASHSVVGSGTGNCMHTVPLRSPMPCSLPFYFSIHVFPLRYITLAHVVTLVAHARTPVSKDAQTYLSALCAHASDTHSLVPTQCIHGCTHSETFYPRGAQPSPFCSLTTSDGSEAMMQDVSLWRKGCKPTGKPWPSWHGVALIHSVRGV